MNVFIWGTGKGSVQAEQVCETYGWKIKAYIDNDREKQGQKKKGLDILSPINFRENYSRKECIMIGTAIAEVQEQAEICSDNVITWQTLMQMLGEIRKSPNYMTRDLQNQNLRNCELLPDRQSLLFRFADQEGISSMAEIGVAFGDFSKQIYSICAPQKLYLIDAWEGERYGGGYDRVTSIFHDQIMSGQIEIRRGYSTEQLLTFRDEELDWVYIDTVHDYETTFQELKISDRKVRCGGYICGHDYTKYNVYSRIDYGVYDAVNRFAVEYGYEFLYLTMEADGLHSFCLRKLSQGEKT